MGLINDINDVLRRLGLVLRISDTDGSVRCPEIYGLPNIQVYTSKSYRENQKLQDADEVYGFSTKVIMHMEFGIRCQCHIHESYSGEQEYKLGGVFVITTTNEHFDLLSCDFDEKYVVTEEGAISFKSLKLTIEDCD